MINKGLLIQFEFIGNNKTVHDGIYQKIEDIINQYKLYKKGNYINNKFDFEIYNSIEKQPLTQEFINDITYYITVFCKRFLKNITIEIINTIE